MSLATIATAISPYFPGCPTVVVTAAVSWAVQDMKNNGVQGPESFEGCIESGAMWHLFDMPAESWTDYDKANQQRILYLAARNRAKIEEGYEYGPSTTAPEF